MRVGPVRVVRSPAELVAALDGWAALLGVDANGGSGVLGASFGVSASSSAASSDLQRVPGVSGHANPVRLLVLRGLPGCGKSTLARTLHTDFGFTHLEADTHFETADGYRFDPARASDAHAWVTREAHAALLAGKRVVIANTHVRQWELAASLGLATLAGVGVVVVECMGAWENVHHVPAEVIETMRGKWEALPEGVLGMRYEA
jgi:predicted kinase